MQLSISGHQLDLTDSLKHYITEKMEKIERHFDHVNTINVVLHVDKIRHEAEATVDAKGVSIHANAESDNMYSAIDALVNKLDSQVLKHKDKMVNHHRNEGGIKHNSLDL
ncbi:MAG: ribosome hibernation-promoting factor, HPF/YfiA family [Arenicella sp.]